MRHFVGLQPNTHTVVRSQLHYVTHTAYPFNTRFEMCIRDSNRGDNRVTIGKACERIVTFWGTDYRRYSRGVHGKVAAERKEETPKDVYKRQTLISPSSSGITIKLSPSSAYSCPNFTISLSDDVICSSISSKRRSHGTHTCPLYTSRCV